MAAALLYLPANRAFNSNGLGIPGATAELYLSGTSTPANFYSNSALSISLGDTITANGAGRFDPAYQDESTAFRLIVKDAAGVQLDDIDPYHFGSLYGASVIGTGLTIAADRSAMSALATTVGTVQLGEAGREGAFVFDASDLSTEVTADTQQGVYVAPSTDSTGASGAWVRTGYVYLTPEMFGCVGDGSTDDYTAWAGMVALVNALGGGMVKLGRGKTYHINRYVGDGLSPALTAAASGMDFNGCTGLVIEGNGAKININGNFDRSSASIYALPGLFISNCTEVVVRNLEIDGNVDQTTNSSAAGESAGSYGVKLRSCFGVTLENVYCHHAATDNFQVAALASTNGTNKFASRRVTMINCRAEYSARLALALIQVRGFHAINCNFDLSGQSTGTYGLHSPNLGVDIEPDNSTASAAPNTMDVNTGDIIFDNCRFLDSSAGILSCILFASVDNVTFRDCKMRGSTGNTTPINLGVPRAKIEKCHIDAKDGTIKLGVVDPNTSVEFVGNYVTGTGLLLQANLATGRMYVARNQYIGAHTTAFAGNIWQVSNSGLILEDNYVWVPKEAFTTGGAGDGHTVFSIANGVKRMARNEFATDLTQTYLGATTAHFSTGISSTIAIPIFEDKYSGTAPGTTDTFRPTANATAFDTSTYFNRKHRTANAPGSLSPGNTSVTFLPSQTSSTVIYDVPITANRTVTLNTAAGLIFKGARVRVIRTPAATGAFNVSVVGATTKAMAASASTQMVIFESLDGATWTQVDFTTF